MTDVTPPVPAESVEIRACRNCGAVAAEAYCPRCGQETTLALPTVRTMLRDAAGRYVALDGRMWRTLFPLLFRPGFLTREYLSGRRRRYIRPTRLFLVLSIALFALLRLVGGPTFFESAAEADPDLARDIAPETPQGKGFSIGPDADLRLDVDAGSWLDPLRRRVAQFNRIPREERGEAIFAGMLRYGPYAAFVLLPLFALILKILYAGRARRYPSRPRRYAAHLVFGAHTHAFVFLVGILILLIPLRALRIALVLWTIAYLLMSMKAVYGGRWSGIVARALVASMVYTVFYGIAVAGLVIAAVLLG
jgi:hypothetical protein